MLSGTGGGIDEGSGPFLRKVAFRVGSEGAAPTVCARLAGIEDGPPSGKDSLVDRSIAFKCVAVACLSSAGPGETDPDNGGGRGGGFFFVAYSAITPGEPVRGGDMDCPNSGDLTELVGLLTLEVEACRTINSGPSLS